MAFWSPRGMVPYQGLGVGLSCWHFGQLDAAVAGMTFVSGSPCWLTHVVPPSLPLWPLSLHAPCFRFRMASEESWLISTGQVTFSVSLACSTLTCNIKSSHFVPTPIHSSTSLHPRLPGLQSSGPFPSRPPKITRLLATSHESDYIFTLATLPSKQAYDQVRCS